MTHVANTTGGEKSSAFSILRNEIRMDSALLFNVEAEHFESELEQ